MIAYLRDFGLKYNFIAESFETSVPWDQVVTLTDNVKQKLRDLGNHYKMAAPPFVSCRVAQSYDTGACVYFYFGFLSKDLKNPMKVFHEVEMAAREEVLRNGGSLSHHHGVGKLRKKWMEQTITAPGIEVLRSIKKTFDPNNVFGNNNLIDL